MAAPTDTTTALGQGQTRPSSSSFSSGLGPQVHTESVGEEVDKLTTPQSEKTEPEEPKEEENEHHMSFADHLLMGAGALPFMLLHGGHGIMEQDPYYLRLHDNIKKDWFKEKKKTYGKKYKTTLADIDELYGFSPKSLAATARREFIIHHNKKKKYAEEKTKADKYIAAEQEAHKKGFDHDPVAHQYQQRMKEYTDERYNKLQELAEEKAKSQGISSKKFRKLGEEKLKALGLYQDYDSVMRQIEEQGWRDFIEKHPEKATAYATLTKESKAYKKMSDSEKKHYDAFKDAHDKQIAVEAALAKMKAERAELERRRQEDDRKRAEEVALEAKERSNIVDRGKVAPKPKDAITVDETTRRLKAAQALRPPEPTSPSGLILPSSYRPAQSTPPVAQPPNAPRSELDRRFEELKREHAAKRAANPLPPPKPGRMANNNPSGVRGIPRRVPDSFHASGSQGEARPGWDSRLFDATRNFRKQMPSYTTVTHSQPPLPRGGPMSRVTNGLNNLVGNATNPTNMLRNIANKVLPGIGNGGGVANVAAKSFLRFILPYVLVILLILLILFFFFRKSSPPASTDGSIPGLTIEKQGPAHVENGQDIPYTIHVEYSGKEAITITDQLPKGTEFSEATGKYENTGSAIVWRLNANTPNVPAPPGTKGYTFTLIVHPTQDDIEVRNKAIATVAGGGGSTLPSNPNPGNYHIMPTDNPLWENFQKVAISIGPTYGFPLSVIVGMAANETGYGTSNFARQRNNWFGFMAYDDNPDMAKSYPSPAESIIDYLDLITKNPRYAKAWSSYQSTHDPVVLLQGIKDAGYASDPVYVQKVSSNPAFKFYAEQEAGR